jgi:hypothetical protein
MGSGHPSNPRDVAQQEGSHSAGRLNLPRNQRSPHVLHRRPGDRQLTPGRDAHPRRAAGPPSSTHRRIRRHGHPSEAALEAQRLAHHCGVCPSRKLHLQQRNTGRGDDRQDHGMAARSQPRLDRSHLARRPERLRQLRDRSPPATKPTHRPPRADELPRPIRVLLGSVASETRRSRRLHLPRSHVQD